MADLAPAGVMRDPDRDLTFAYRTHWMRVDGRCRLRLWRREQIAVVTELDANPGPSITNAIESVAGEIERTLGVLIGPGDWMLVEHYPPDSRRAATFAVVHFCARDSKGRPVGPAWSPVRDVELADLLRASS